MKHITWAGLIVAVALSVGCTATQEHEDDLLLPGGGTTGDGSGVIGTPDSGDDGTTGQPIADDSSATQQTFDPQCPPPCEFTRDAVTDPASLLAQKIIYFDYDQSAIRAEFMELVAAHGRYLATYPDVKVRLEGHADERGSREYNIALGEGRGAAVRRQLLLQGVGSDQLEIVSYGEELPAALGHDDESWAQNRRVEIVYQ